MRRDEPGPGRTARLDAEVCALLVVQAELICLAAESEHWPSLAEQRDRLRAGLSPAQLEQLRRIAHSLAPLAGFADQSEAA